MKLKVMLEKVEKAIRFRKHIVMLGDDYCLVYDDHEAYLKNVFNDLKLHGFTRPRFKDGCLYATQPK
jgi:hypothetical protein